MCRITPALKSIPAKIAFAANGAATTDVGRASGGKQKVLKVPVAKK
ncbi:MAG: hypothetical protein Q7T18_06780 [Sedimentisphaerales bacterium]|nr:hypothetical protein [Sedimentisphaerales bacterium]